MTAKLESRIASILQKMNNEERSYYFEQLQKEYEHKIRRLEKSRKKDICIWYYSYRLGTSFADPTVKERPDLLCGKCDGTKYTADRIGCGLYDCMHGK